VDIPWLSLSNSPWPISHGNVQRTGRSKFTGPQQGIIEWKFPNEGQSLRENNGSAVIGEDGTIYFTTSHYLYALNPNGLIKWKIYSDKFWSGSPMIGTGDIIYLGTGYDDNGCYYAIDNQGNIIWEFITQENLYSSSDALGLDGTIYFTGSKGTLYALNPDGSLKWQTNSTSGFNFGRTSIAMSPDGSILYIGGNDSTLNAVDVQTSKIIWKFFRGAIFNNTSSLVDSEGNIYLYAREQSNYKIISLNSAGKMRWKTKDDVLNQFNPTVDMHMDKDGFIYFCTNTRFGSLDYSGNLRWAVPFNGQSPYGAVLGDVNGIIYFGGDYLLAYNQNGKKKLECNLTHPLVNGAISDNNRLYLCAEPNFYCIK
jgi:outer membrane protein assembly factor BamB